jgi:transcriptional regulator with XRE-family HTH domain
LRKARGLTLTDLADASGLSIGYLSLLERDRATPSIKALHAVSRALGVTITWFFEANEVPEEERDPVVGRARRRRLDY